MIQTKIVELCDGISVTIRRRKWAEACESTLAHMDALNAIAESDMSEAQKTQEGLKIDLEYREKPMRLYVENWEELRPLLSQAAFTQLERELADFSKSELVEGN